MGILQDKGIKNTFICVSRIKTGYNIGPARFRHIKECANQALAKRSDKEPPTFNQITI